jgi:hypothetical protein
MKSFKRGIGRKFVEALQALSKVDGWWRDVLLDDKLIIAVRDECLNVYWRGQSIFRIVMKGGSVVAETHPKYLVDPAMSKLVSFNGTTFDLGGLRDNALISTYASNETLQRMKKAAALYAGDEKCGVHDIVVANDNVIDVEIAMSSAGIPDAGELPRVDIAAFEEEGDEVYLVLWEAKTFYNSELKITGKKNVVEQIGRYKSAVAGHLPNIISSYSVVSQNLRDISQMSGGLRKISDSIRKVAEGAELQVRSPVDVGLIVFGFDAAQKEHVWSPLRKDLEKVLEPNRIKAIGDAKGLLI